MSDLHEDIGKHVYQMKADKERMEAALEDKSAFIFWLFRESGHIKHISFEEAWSEYEEQFLTEDEVVDKAIQNIREAGFEVTVINPTQE